MICLGVTGKDRRPTTWLFDKEDITLGRSSANDLVFDLAVDSVVSRRHAMITRRGKKYFIEDLQSTQGTLSQPRPHPWRVGAEGGGRGSSRFAGPGRHDFH